MHAPAAPRLHGLGMQHLSLLSFASCLCVYVAALHAVCLHAQHLQLTQHTLHLHLSTTCIQHLIKSSTSALGALKPPTFTLKWDLVFVFVSCRHCVKRSRTCMDCASSPPPPSPDTGLSSVMGRGGNVRGLVQLPGMARSIKMLETVCVKRLWTSQNWGAEAGCCCSHQPGGLPSRENVLRVVCFQLEHVGAVRAPVHGTRTRHPLKKRAGRRNFIALPHMVPAIPSVLCSLPSPPSPPPPAGDKKAALHTKGRGSP